MMQTRTRQATKPSALFGQLKVRRYEQPRRPPTYGHRTSQPLLRPGAGTGQVGFAPLQRDDDERRFKPQHREEEHANLAALAEGRAWIARRTLGVRCPGCGREYQEAPAIHWEDDMALADNVWDGRVYRLGPHERAHADAFHWRVWWQDDEGCNLPASYAVTEAQVLAWTDQCGPWRRHR
jgi:hypothetical protein